MQVETPAARPRSSATTSPPLEERSPAPLGEVAETGGRGEEGDHRDQQHADALRSSRSWGRRRARACAELVARLVDGLLDGDRAHGTRALDRHLALDRGCADALHVRQAAHELRRSAPRRSDRSCPSRGRSSPWSTAVTTVLGASRSAGFGVAGPCGSPASRRRAVHRSAASSRTRALDCWFRPRTCTASRAAGDPVRTSGGMHAAAAGRPWLVLWVWACARLRRRDIGTRGSLVDRPAFAGSVPQGWARSCGKAMQGRPRVAQDLLKAMRAGPTRSLPPRPRAGRSVPAQGAMPRRGSRSRSR